MVDNQIVDSWRRTFEISHFNKNKEKKKKSSNWLK